MQESETEPIARYRSAVEALAGSQRPPEPQALLALLLLRERIAEEIAARPPAVATLEALAQADNALLAEAPRLVESPAGERLRDWRRSLGERSSSWWWCLDKAEATDLPGPSLPWIAAAGALLATALTLMTDFTVRLLREGPDQISLLSTLLQGFLVLLAGGTLTAQGRRWFETRMRRRGVSGRRQGPWMAAASAAVLLLAVAIWSSLPFLGRYYSNRGVRLQAAGQLPDAIKSFARSLRAAPGDPYTHYNLATAEEDIQDREAALRDYRAALAGNSGLSPAYNNLGRLYILARDYPAAVELLQRGVLLQPEDAAVRYALHKNLAWAYLEMELPGQAEDQVRQALALRKDGAAAHCLLAELREKRPALGEALPAWRQCLAGAGAGAEVESQWLARAEERLREEELP